MCLDHVTFSMENDRCNVYQQFWFSCVCLGHMTFSMEDDRTQCISTNSIPTHVPTYQMLPLTKPDSAVPLEKCCTQLKCKAILPDGYQFKTCEKCLNISRLCMQKKRKWDQADEEQGYAPLSNTHLENETEPQNKVSRWTFGFLKEHLPGRLFRMLSNLRTKIWWWHG